MLRSGLIFILALLFSVAETAGQTVVADSVSRMPLPNASVFDLHGRLIGICKSDGRLPYVSPDDYPVTIRYMGFEEKSVDGPGVDTVFMQEYIAELPEVVVESRQQKLLHMLAYVREYSTLATYSDTVFLFREKMVDYMLPLERKSKFAGWRNPHILTSKSYYRYSDGNGLDSVSDRCNQHFSWADWVGIVPATEVAPALRHRDTATDTVRGKYSPTEIWNKNSDRITLDVNVLADTTSRKWVPNLSFFFRDDIDFEQFLIRFNYNNTGGDSIAPADLTGYSFNIASNGRGRGMFMFNRRDEPFFVSTYAEVYFVDKEYITVKEARQWQKLQSGANEMDIYIPDGAPELQPSIIRLMARVSNVDHDNIRLALAPDQRLAGGEVARLNAGQMILKRLKGIFGLDHVAAKRKWKREWNEFRIEQSTRNKKSRDAR